MCGVTPLKCSALITLYCCVSDWGGLSHVSFLGHCHQTCSIYLVLSIRRFMSTARGCQIPVLSQTSMGHLDQKKPQHCDTMPYSSAISGRGFHRCQVGHNLALNYPVGEHWWGVRVVSLRRTFNLCDTGSESCTLSTAPHPLKKKLLCDHLSQVKSLNLL